MNAADDDAFSHLRRLSGVRSCSGIRFLSAAVSPGNHCPMRIASVVVEKIPGLSSLLLGTAECATHSRLFSPKPEGPNGELHWLYVLDEREVVFGYREGLADALRRMDRAGAQAILLIATCIPELTGEDIEGVLREVQPELSARVTNVLLGQFRNVSYPPGSWKTMEALGELMDPRPADPRRVNILGRSPGEDHIPLPPLLPALERRGFVLRHLAPGASVADFQAAADATLNLVVSPYALPLAARMERDFGIPRIDLHSRYDTAAIDRAHAEIASLLGITWDDEFDADRRAARELETLARETLRGLRFVFSLRIDLPLPLAAYLASLGMEPVLLHLEDFYGDDREQARAITDLGHDPLVCRIVNIDADLPTLASLAPDLCLGYLPEANTAIPCVPDMFDFYGQTGHARTSRLLEKILGVLDHASAFIGKGGAGDGAAPL